MIWNYSPLDINTLGMVNSGSWLFDYKIDKERLQDSLDKVLTSYPVFCGKCIGNGIEYEETGKFKGCEITFENGTLTSGQISSNWKLPIALKADFNLKAFKKGKVAPINVKVTDLADGTMLGVAFSHSCCDGATLMRFVNDWARTFRGEPIEKPIFDQALLPVLTDSKDDLMNILPAEGWYRVSLKVLFNHIWDTLRGINRKAPKVIFLPGIRTNTEVCEWLSVKAGNKPGFIHVVDLRSRCLPEAFCGNAVVNLQDISIMHDSVKLARYFRLNMESMQNKVPFTGFDLNGISGSKPRFLMVNNFCKFPIYEPDFGCGKPLKVYPNDLPDTIKVWPGTPAENGVYLFLRGNAIDCC
ncbi:MAG: hypothetical protein LKK08_04035 [Bacteroidales bacterium]|jgi:hypothetical protein|nr:hypothetical protein [Bacteroidales bacterium]MCI2145400.1 hypothetical protein [Bacteroidales bacterium]